MSAENIFTINLEALADAARPMTRNLNIAIGGRPAWPVSCLR